MYVIRTLLTCYYIGRVHGQRISYVIPSIYVMRMYVITSFHCIINSAKYSAAHLGGMLVALKKGRALQSVSELHYLFKSSSTQWKFPPLSKLQELGAF